MITYSTNWMGPINSTWIEEHGNHWAGGRIDIRESDIDIPVSDEILNTLHEFEIMDLYQLSPFGEEYGLPIMHVEDWNRFSEWLLDYKTTSKVSFDKIISDYEKDNSNIRWFKHED